MGKVEVGSIARDTRSGSLDRVLGALLSMGERSRQWLRQRNENAEDRSKVERLKPIPMRKSRAKERELWLPGVNKTYQNEVGN